MVKSVIAAPVGDNKKAVFSGIREFPTEKVYLVAPAGKAKNALSTQRELQRFGMSASVVQLRGDLWEGMFRTIAELSQTHPNLVINVAAATDPRLQCIATCAAFVNGLKAFGVDESGEVVVLPVLKFSYYTLLTDKKLSLLRAMDNPSCCASLRELGRKSGMSLPLVSYHVNGNQKTPGLVSLGLAEARGRGRRTSIHLTALGRMLVRGHVGLPEDPTIGRR